MYHGVGHAQHLGGVVLSLEEGCIADPCAWDAVEATAAAARPATAALPVVLWATRCGLGIMCETNGGDRSKNSALARQQALREAHKKAPRSTRRSTGSSGAAGSGTGGAGGADGSGRQGTCEIWAEHPLPDGFNVLSDNSVSIKTVVHARNYFPPCCCLGTSPPCLALVPRAMSEHSTRARHRNGKLLCSSARDPVAAVRQVAWLQVYYRP